MVGEPARHRARRGWVAPLLLAVLAFVAYANSFRGPFVFDDVGSIPENASLRHWDTVLSPPAHGETVTGRPVLNATFALNYALGGEKVWGYHLVNLLIHLSAGLLLFGVVRRTLRRVRGKGRSERMPDLVAFAVAALWLAHPLQTEAVTYIVQRAESLMALIYLATLYTFVRATDGEGGQDRAAAASGTWLGLSVGACALGMGAKEVMVSAPVIVWLYDRTFVAGTFLGAWRRRGWYYGGLAATWIILALEVLSAGGDRGGSTGGFHLREAWLAHAVTQFHSVVTYVRLTAWPFPQAFDYQPIWPASALDVLPFALIVLALAGLIAIALRRNAPAGFAGIWFGAILAPTSLVPAPTQLVAEHRMYLALAPVLALAGAAMWRLAGRRSVPALLAVAAVFAVLSLSRNRVYRSGVALWRDTVFRQPSHGMAHLFLGNVLRAQDRLAEAMAEYELAVELAPSAIAFNACGSLLTYMGRAPEAVPMLDAAVTDHPKEPEYHYNFGLALAATGRMEDAVRQFEAAVKLKPDYDIAENNLGNALVQLHRPTEAARHFIAATRINPLNADAHYNLGTIWLQARQWDAAARELRRASVLTPNDADAHAMLGRALEAQGRPLEAIAEYEAAVRLKPSQAVAQRALDRLRRR